MDFYAIFFILGSFSGHSGVLEVNQKNLENSKNTYRTELYLCELNFIDNTLKVEYKFGAWQILFKKTCLI